MCYLDIHSGITDLATGCFLSVMSAPWSVVFVFDTIVFLLTLYKTKKSCDARQSRLLHVFMRDGRCAESLSCL